MKKLALQAVKAALVIALFAGCVGASGVKTQNEPASRKKYAARKTLHAFRSEQELKSYFHELAEKLKAEQSRRGYVGGVGAGVVGSLAQSMGPAAAPSKLANSAADKSESVTSTQVAGVDEGGIVKVHGNHLVMLRRGRLFTVAIGDGALEPVSAVDAYAPDADPRGTWYDEMLISGDTIAVIGYSYARGGTEVNLFQIDSAGNLSYKST